MKSNVNSPANICHRIDLSSPTGRKQLDELRSKLISQGDMISPASRQRTIDVFGEPLTPREVVRRICTDVRSQGVEALLDYSHRIDGSSTSQDDLFVPAAWMETCHKQMDSDFLATIRRIRERVEFFQNSILNSNVSVSLPGGGSLGQRYVPLDRVGVCVPGGAAAYPSTLLMTVVPAQVAGVEEIIVVAPPTKFGADNHHVLATCFELGIKTVMRAGGAQAVAAMAYGISNLPRVDMIVGPGNLFVALAKEFVFGDVAIDSIAGPSEIVVVADVEANAEFIAADMLAQAEHSPGSAIVLTASSVLADQITQAISKRLKILERSELTQDSLSRFGAVVLTKTDDESAEIANELAPEHLSVVTRDPQATLAKIRHAGAAFLGPWSPVAAGDYAAGPSHVLPTGGTARFFAGLSANHFLRSSSVVQLSQTDLKSMADDIRLLADVEGLTAHRRSIEARTEE